LAFHDRVLRGVVGGYGADLTPRIFYENFIDVMVTINASDGYLNAGLRGRRPNAQLTGGADQGQLMQRIVGQTRARLGQPDRAILIMAIRQEVGVLRKQPGLQLIQARANLLAQIRARRVRRGTGRLPLREQTVLHQFVGLHLCGDQLGHFFWVELALGGERAGIGNDLRFTGAVLDRLATVPFGQSDEIADVQAFVQCFQQRFHRLGARRGLGGVGASGEQDEKCAGELIWKLKHQKTLFNNLGRWLRQ